MTECALIEAVMQTLLVCASAGTAMLLIALPSRHVPQTSSICCPYSLLSLPVPVPVP
jgi:hypothetical protein